jgi:outer membrane protein OmpA-like peptidoglycan-associated protein
MLRLIPSLALCAGVALAQIPNPTQQIPQTENRVPSQTGEPVPIFRVTVVQRTTQAVSYRFRSGWTKVDLQGTNLAPEAKGHADVNSRNGYIEVKAEMHKLQPASKYGPEYLTYVLWAITPEGRANNLGEVRLNGDNAGLDVTTELQAFGLIVTAEPYFAVTTPSDVVVMENIIRPDTVGKIQPMNAKYELLQRGQYTLNVPPGSLHPVVIDEKAPPELYEARNAVQIARFAGADRYATDTYNQAEQLLKQAEQYQARKERKPAQMTAREAVQKCEDARIIAIRKQDEERLAQERQAAADREAQAKAETEAEAQRRAQAETARNIADQDRMKAEQERAAAERAKAEAQAAARQAASERVAADQARAQADQARAQAEAARQAALAQQQLSQTEAEKARQQASEADRLRQKAELDRDQLRQQLLQQLNMVLETRETARGLIVNMSDVLFDFGKYTLKPGAREKLSKIAGIVIAHPGLMLEVEGHTDNVGSDEFNQKLSEQRASAVREYLVQQGLSPDSITSKGMGKADPVASNATAAGRQQNRRVEMVVSGDVIGTKIQSMRMNVAPQTATPPRQ